MLPLLHAVQDTLGHVPDEAVGPIAQALSLSRAEVHGVITYCTTSSAANRPGSHVVQICRAEACQACGGEQLQGPGRARVLGCGGHATRADGA